MFIQLFQITLFNNYIISPKTWIHQMPYKTKTLLLFIYLLFIPYVNVNYMIISIISLLWVVIFLQIPRHYIINFKELLFIFFISLLNNHIYIYNINYMKIQPTTHLYINKVSSPIKCINQNQNIRINTPIKCDSMIPLYIFRGIIIYLIYIGHTRILNLTTTYEKIIYYYTIHAINKHYKNFFIDRLLITILSSQFIILIVMKIDQLTKVLNLRSISYSPSYYDLLKYSLNSTYMDIQRISYNLSYIKKYRF